MCFLFSNEIHFNSMPQIHRVSIPSFNFIKPRLPTSPLCSSCLSLPIISRKRRNSTKGVHSLCTGGRNGSWCCCSGDLDQLALSLGILSVSFQICPGFFPHRKATFNRQTRALVFFPRFRPPTGVGQQNVELPNEPR